MLRSKALQAFWIESVFAFVGLGGGRRNLYQAGGEENGIYGYALLLVEFGLVLLQTWVLVQDFQEVQSLSKKG